MPRFVFFVATVGLAYLAGVPAMGSAQGRGAVRLELVPAARLVLVGPMAERLRRRLDPTFTETRRERLDAARDTTATTSSPPTDAQLRAAVFSSVDVAVRGVLPLAFPRSTARTLRRLAPIADRVALDAARARVTEIRDATSNRRKKAACEAALSLMTRAVARSTPRAAARAAGGGLADVVVASVAAGAPAEDAFEVVLPTGPPIAGAISKGPFVAGSSVTIVALNERGRAIAPAANTWTTNDLGEYAVAIPHRGLLSVEGRGYGYDELTGEISRETMSLRALARASDGAGAMNANVITHACYERTLYLLGQGSEFEAAAALAEAELHRALSLATPATRGRLLRVDRDDELLLLSAALIEVANTSGSTVQSVIDGIADDLADDGALDPNFSRQLLRAYRVIDATEVRARLDRRFGEQLIGGDR